MKADLEEKQLAKEIKRVALKAGADLVGIVSASAIDALPSIRVGWTIQEHTKKTTDIMPDAKSIVVLGYHVWDDMLEIAILKGGKWVYPGYLPLRTLSLKVIHHLEKKGYTTAPCRSVSYKRLAQLAGFGNFGRNALIINPTFGPWIRLAPVLTNAEMTPDKPFDQDLCSDCENCVKACPVGALTPYRVDDTKCLVGVHIIGKEISKYAEELKLYEPSLTKNSHLMCTECQKACRYGKERH
ncbi:MAG: 4Fe-4S binding protein [Candidatus Bathyarchaeota archaeon]|nr:4Fe-4S binding protein [Candidatus Bathyarchaeota archaeon]